jgi:glycosyltransferase involved in cell wall biosynthesis
MGSSDPAARGEKGCRHTDGVKILHAMPSLARAFGGPVEALIGYVEAAGLSGNQCTVVGPACDPEDLRWLREAMPETEVIAVGVAGESSLRSAGRVEREVSGRLRESDAVHVHGLLNPVSSLAARSAIRRRAAVIIGPFGTLSRYTFSHRRRLAKSLYFRSLDADNLRRASGVHFTTAAERDEAAWHGIDFEGRAYVVPPPFRMARPRPGNPSDREARLSSRGERTETVLFLGRLVPTKGVELLLEAWSLVRDERPRARLVIAGSGTRSYESRLRSSGPRSAPADRDITFTGFVSGESKERWLTDADLFVLPSHHENFGIAVLEAIAAGIPVVVSPAVQLAPWIVSHGLGVIADRTPRSLAAAITAALEDGQLRSRAAASGFEAVADAFQPKVIAPALDAMYRGAAARNGASESASHRSAS